MNFTNVEFAVGILMLLSLAGAGIGYLNRDKIKAWNDARQLAKSTWVNTAIVAAHSDAITKAVHERIVSIETAVQAAVTRSNTAIKVATASATPVVADDSPAPLKAKVSTMNEGTGSIPASSLIGNFDGLFFLLQVNRMFPGSDNLPFHVLSGSADDINEVINYAHNTGQEPLLDPHVKDWMTGYSGPLKDAVKPLIQAGINKRTNAWSRRIYQGYFDKYLA